MKKLLAITLLSLSTLSIANCTLPMDIKKIGASTAYIDGVSVSKKIRTAISAKCDIKFKVLSSSEISDMNISNAVKRLAKLRAKASK